MPTKYLDSPITSKGYFHFGGGADTIFTTSLPGTGYLIDSGGGDDVVFGSSADDTIAGGDGSDQIYGGAGDDTIYGGTDATIFGGTLGSLDSSKGQNPAPSNYLMGDGVFSETTGPDDINMTVSGDFTGGNDTIHGGNGSDDHIYGDMANVTFTGSSSFQGGADVLYAGDGGTNYLYGDAVSITGALDVTGGNDTLYAGTGDDNMWGDWASASGSGTVATGADTFVFTTIGGTDNINDFEVAKDTIDLSGTHITEAILDSNQDGAITVDDQYVYADVGDHNLRIDLGAADGSGASGSVIVHGVDSIDLGHFDFAPIA